VETTRLLAFAGTFALIAMSPGLCMTLAMTLGIRIGVKRTLWMMLGELTGIALVGSAAMAGIAAILIAAPRVFTAFKICGAAYLMWTAWRSWRAPVGDLAQATDITPAALCAQGFVTAVSNPKAWAFMGALLPPFINPGKPLAPQIGFLLVLMILIEFASLLIYAQGGRTLSELLLRRGQAQLLNRVSATLMVGVAIWLLIA